MKKLNYEIVTTHPKLPTGNVPSLIVHQGLDNQIIDIIRTHYVESIVLAHTNISDLSFLKQLEGYGIRDMAIDRYGVKDLRPLEYIKDTLESLSLATPFTQAPDFSTFPKLWCVGMDWRPAGKSLLKSKSITQFGIEKGRFKNLEPFAEMQQLKSLGFTWGTLETLDGIENLPNLEEFSVGLCRSFKSLDGIQNAPKLTKEKTVITKCKQITEDSPYAEYVTFNDLY